MKKLKKVGLIILIFMAFITFSIVYTKFYFIPLYKKILFSKVNIDRHNKIIEEMNINIFIREKETNKLKSTKKEFRESLKGLPQTERNPEIVRSILNFSNASGALLETVHFGEISEVEVKSEIISDKNNTKKEKLIMVPVKLSLKGNYLQVKKFIELLEGDKRIVQIDNISINKNNTQIKMVYYYFNSSVNREEPYDFCNKIYGKEDMFK